jgi:thiol-disulfide isomerase/thioredoxin
LPEVGGRERTLEEFRGKVLLVNFWASWCTPCLEEMPRLLRLADDALRGKPFAILGVNVEESRFRAMSTAQRLKLDFPILLDNEGAVFTRWGATVLPTTYVLDAAGVVRYIAQGPIEWDSTDVMAMLDSLRDAPAQGAPADGSTKVDARP